MGGIFADALAFMELSLTLRWLSSDESWMVYLLNFKGLDFLFFTAFVVGIFAIRRLAQVREKGEAPREVVYRGFLTEAGRAIRNLSNVGAFYSLIYFPTQLQRRRTKTNNKK